MLPSDDRFTPRLHVDYIELFNVTVSRFYLLVGYIEPLNATVSQTSSAAWAGFKERVHLSSPLTFYNFVNEK